MIVHRLVPISQSQYYLEASPRIPMDSVDYPHLAVVAAIVYDGRNRLAEATLSVTNASRSDPGRDSYAFYGDRITTRAMRLSQVSNPISETSEQHFRHYHGNRMPRTVRSPSQFFSFS
jgi:hypothetical protein